jgi:hypothetical protein
MAKKDRQEPTAAAPDSPLRRARWAMEAGDVRRARSLAAEAAKTGSEPEKVEAQRLLERLGPDPRALMVVAAVLVLISIAAWFAILRR